MHIHLVLRRIATLALLASAAAFAVETHVWEQSDQSDFSHGTPKHIAIRSDGRIALSPTFKELDSTTVPYLWAIAHDSKGNVYYAGGAPTGASTKIFVLAPGKAGKVFAEVPGLEIHALAVDAQDRLYAAVLPDAKVYRITAGGKPEVFFDPKCKYIWSLVFDRSGNLFAATGDSGIIFKIDAQGKGSEFARTDETHARCMILDHSGNLIVGTEPGGLVERIDPKGQTFVLYQTDKREVTALAEQDGILYAAAVGKKGGNLSVSGPAPVLPSTPPPANATGTPHTGKQPPMLAPAIGSLSAAVSGGSEVYRIDEDGAAESIWESPTDIAYALAFDAGGHPIVGTGNKGVIYRVDSDQLSTELLNAPPTQVTALLQVKNLVYAATGNVGNLYSIGPGMERSGTLESDVLNANGFAYWGKAHLTSTLHDGKIALEVRSGNLDTPEHNWSKWSAVPVEELGGQISAPAARFLQYRLTLTASPKGESPELSAVDIPFLPKNLAPRVRQIEIAPLNYRQSATNFSLERSLTPSGSPTTLSLPAVGQKRSSSSSNLSETAGAATLQYSKGFATLRWSASDANNDPLLFKVDIKGKNESSWRPLKDKLVDPYYAFDTTAFPDGEYVVRVTASDAPGNTAQNTLTSTLISDSFTIDNTPPELGEAKLTDHTLSITAKDKWSWIAKAEYSVNGGEWLILMPVNRVTDSQVLQFEASAKPGDHVAVRVFDENDNVAVKQFTLPGSK